MRRFALVYVFAAAALVAACSSDQPKPAPTEPSAPSSPKLQPSLSLGQCRQNGLIVVQLAAILPAGPPLRLLTKALEKFGSVEAALFLGKKSLAQTRALDLINFIFTNRNNLIGGNSQATLTKLGNVTDAILCEVGLPPTGVTITPTTGIGVVTPTTAPVIVATPQGDAGINIPPGGLPATDVNGAPVPGLVVTVTKISDVALNTPLDKYGQAIELTASQEVLWQQGGVTVAVCVTGVDDQVFNRLRVGHEGGTPNFGAIEILPPASAQNIAAVLGTACGATSNQGGFDGLKEFAKRVLLPDPLYAFAAPPTSGGVGGLAGKFSKFQAVDPQLDVVANPGVSTDGLAGAPVSNPPSVLVRTKTQLTSIPGIPIKFKVTAGTGSIVPADPNAVVTSNLGVATATSWTLGFGSNTATGTASAPAGVTELTFTAPGAVTFNAQGAPPPPAFGASDWSYLVVPSAPSTTDWTALQWPVTATGWARAPAPFGSVPIEGTSPSGCSDQAPTPWGVNQSILLRRNFFVPAGFTTGTITVRIDNDIQVFVNGSDATAGLQRHGGCADVGTWFKTGGNVAGPPGPFTFTVNQGKVNTLAILGVDEGVESFVDAQVTLSP